MLTDNQIKRYLKYSKCERKRVRDKALAMLTKDFEKHSLERINKMKKQYKEVIGHEFIERVTS